MSVLFYREERDMDFLNACESVRIKNNHLSIKRIAKIAISMPAKCFYLHPRGYSNIIRGGGRKLPKNLIKRALHNEILKRFREMPPQSVAQAAMFLAQQNAPRFYISESRASSLYYELLKKRKPTFRR